MLTSEVWFNSAVITGWWGVWADFICPHPDKAEVGRDSDSKLDLPEASELVFGSLKQSEGWARDARRQRETEASVKCFIL